MIQVTVQGKSGDIFYLNPHVIETIKCHPDTVITLLSGRVYVVAESYSTIYDQIIKYRRSLGLYGNEE